MTSEILQYKVLEIDTESQFDAAALAERLRQENYGGIFCLVRKNGRPVRVAEIPLHDGDAPARLKALLSEPHAIDFGPPPPARAMAAKADIVIATRNRPESLAKCLDSMMVQDYPSFSVIVVDNGSSTPAAAELINQRYAETGRVRYVREDRPGLGRAHNAALPHVTSPLVAFTDDDVVADPHWLSALCQNFDQEGRTGCVTGLILPAELDTRAQVWTEKHGGFGKGFTRRIFDGAERHPDQPLFPFTAGQFGSGANMAFTLDALKKIGGFDPALGAGTPARGGDDLAAFYAVIDAGYRLVYEPEAIVWHHHRREEQGMRRQAFGYGMGLGAYLTKLVVERPANAVRLARVFPVGVRHMFGASSGKTQRLPEDYPSSLIWRERLGILAGVPGYLRSRMVQKRLDREASLAGRNLHSSMESTR